MAKAQLGIAEWRAEIERVLGRSSDKGLSSRELSKLMGISLRTTMERLRALQEAGRLGCGWRQITSLDGKAARCPVYWVKPEKS